MLPIATDTGDDGIQVVRHGVSAERKVVRWDMSKRWDGFPPCSRQDIGPWCRRPRQQGFRDSFGGLAGVEQDANRVGGRCAVAVVRHAEVRCVGVVDVALRGFAHDASILVILDNYLA